MMIFFNHKAYKGTRRLGFFQQGFKGILMTFFPQLMVILGKKALNARPIKAMGAAHGSDHKSCFLGFG
jgi:hypothetical protein